MNQKEAIEKLKKEVSSNPAVDAVFHVFAMRKRARARLALPVLAKSMIKEGYSFNTSQYEEVLKLLANTGFGHLEKDHKGKIRALRDIKVTFKSLGEAVCGQKTTLKTFYSRNKFYAVNVPKARKAVIDTPSPEAVISRVKGMGLKFVLMLDETRHMDVSIPDNITGKEVADLISRLRKKESA